MIGRIALLGDYAEKPRLRAFAHSCRQSGFAVEPVVRSEHARPDEFDFAFTSGRHRAERVAFARFARAGKQVVVLDLGYVHRASYEDQTGYHQVGLGRIGWVPPGPLPDDRFLDLGINVLPTLPRPRGPLLVLGQMPGDSQHPFAAPRPMQWWLRNQLGHVRKKIASPTRIVYRPHPLAKTDRGLADFASDWEWQSPAEVPLHDAVAEAAIVLTYNSTAGLEAIRQGVPVVCAQEAHYSDVAWAPQDLRLRYFHRLAYAQWTLDEIERGEALAFLLSMEWTDSEKRQSGVPSTGE